MLTLNSMTRFALGLSSVLVLSWLISPAAAQQPVANAGEPQPIMATVLKPVYADLPSVKKPQTLSWETDYQTAWQRAEQDRKKLLIVFTDRTTASQFAAIERQLAESKHALALDAHILANIPTDAKITVNGRETRVLDSSAFSELHGSPGVAIIDLASVGTSYYKHVVNQLPFRSGKYYHFASSSVPTLLTLPEGTLTQRSMIFAVRTHPEAPQSTGGDLNPLLLDEATSHSQHQANIRTQGHHNWDNRFQRIRGRLALFGGRSGTPREVVAESWPNQDLMDSCVDCVHSWRQSSGHWGAVRSPQSQYAYDIRRGSNGIWYATGLFSN